jgi:hypothetical protein
MVAGAQWTHDNNLKQTAMLSAFVFTLKIKSLATGGAKAATMRTTRRKAGNWPLVYGQVAGSSTHWA